MQNLEGIPHDTHTPTHRHEGIGGSQWGYDLCWGPTEMMLKGHKQQPKSLTLFRELQVTPGILLQPERSPNCDSVAFPVRTALGLNLRPIA